MSKNLLGRAHDKEFWKSVATSPAYKKHIDGLFEIIEKDGTDALTELLYSDFKLFRVTGDRSVYEAQYFRRRRLLSAYSILALIYPEDEKYINSLMDIIFAICNEYTWCLPAHYGTIDRMNENEIDLFAAETSFALSEIYTLLGERLEPIINGRIKTEIKRRIIDTYTGERRFGWERSDANWAAVCMCSVGCTVMLMFPELFESLKPRFDNTFECYLSGFKDDGICAEGCTYWYYGFGFFTVYADMVRTFTDGECDYFKREKIKNVATFIQKALLTKGCGISFSDGGGTFSYNLGHLHRLKDEYGELINVFSPKYSFISEGCSRFCLHLRSFTWFCEEYYNNFADENTPDEYFAKDSSWFIKRTRAYGFAAKGGHNDEPHNHNDVGAFIFAKNGKQILCDMGSGTYTRQYFDNQTRYGILECSSRSHCVPIIDGCYQSFGRGFAAGSFDCTDGELRVEFAGAYDVEGLQSIERAFSFDEDTVYVSDTVNYTGKGDIIDRFTTMTEPVIEDGKVIIGDATLTYDSAIASLSVSYEDSTKGRRLYMLDFKIKPGDTFRLSIK